MAVLVDELRCYTRVGHNGPWWCHMMTDGEESELHAFAAQLGLRRTWFQGDHYDLVPRRRAKAIDMGAREVTAKELVQLRISRRKGDSK